MRLQKIYASIVLVLISSFSHGNDLIADTVTMVQIREGINRIYNYEFDTAAYTLDSLRRKYPDHPITSFYEGLIYYWKYYPLIPEQAGSSEFEWAMEESWERADSLKELQCTSEAVFFDLMSRSFIVMYHADNGRSSRAIPHIGTLYRDILKGFEMQEDFREFMFITGLYNYYREAYPKAYPIYKPATMFFKKGDKDRGLEMLRSAAAESNFLHVEAALFLSLIHVNFENNPDSAVWYASLLHQNYPGNAYFHSKYTEMLLVNRQYEQALDHINQLMRLDDYNRMKGSIFRGIYEEKKNRDPETARRHYEAGLYLAEPFGDRANYTKAYAYIGLSRYYMEKEEKKRAREYLKKAKKSTGYSYVFE